MMALLLGSLTIAACNQQGNTSKAGDSQAEQGSSKRTRSVSTFVPSSFVPVDLPKYEVKFVDANGAEISKETMEHGSKLTKPATDPTAPAGQKFYGWMNTKNGGQIWDFEADDINVVMQDVELKPLFIPDLQAQPFEAELVPAITEDNDGRGMEGATYSGGAKGSQLVNKRDKGHVLKSSGDYWLEDDDSVRYATPADDPSEVFGSFVHFMYKKGDTLTWKLQSDAAAENVVIMMRLSGEYGLDSTETDEVSFSFTDKQFPVKVNGTALDYGKITIHNVNPMFWNTFQDYYLSASVNLKAGENIIEMIVDNTDTLNGTIESTAPCVDCIKLFSTSNLTWPEAKLENLEF